MWQKLWLFRRWVACLLLCLVVAACSQVDASKTAIALVETPTPSPTVSSSPQSPAVAAPNLAMQPTQNRMAGFSSDGAYYLYLESWKDMGAGIPNATLQVVQIDKNQCLKQGCLETNFGEADAHLSLQDAENSLLQKTSQLRQALQLDTPRPGTALPITERSRLPDKTETVTVMVDGKPLDLRLTQKYEASVLAGGQADMDRAAMQLTMTYGGQQQIIGDLNQFHDWAMDFSIREVQQAPQGNGIVVLLNSTTRAYEGALNRTLVQSFDL